MCQNSHCVSCLLTKFVYIAICDDCILCLRNIEFTWYTWVHTSDVRGAGTDANVYLVVYGNKGKSDEVWLDNESNNFETGQTDNFKIEIADVGKPYKIRIGHDNSNPASAWHLNKVYSF